MKDDPKINRLIRKLPDIMAAVGSPIRNTL